METTTRQVTAGFEAKDTSQDQINENEAIESFLKVVNGSIRNNENPMSERTALKFLISRKFDIQRALQLYQMHEITRLQEGLTTIDIQDESLKCELNSGKFTIFQHKDPNGSAISMFTAKLHAPFKSSKNQALRKKIHRTTLQGIVYQLDSALEDVGTQRSGIVFIYNMSDSDFSNFDYDLCQKILNLLKGAYPAKLKKVLIVSPPLWFRAPFHLLRLIVREKLRDRVWLLSKEQLKEHISTELLPTQLGGSYRHDHSVWLEQCNTIHKTSLNDICDASSAENIANNINQRPSITSFRRQSIENSLGFGQNDELCPQIKAMVSRGNNNQNKPAYDYDDGGLSLEQFIDMIRVNGRTGLGDEYESIVRSEKTGTFLVSTNQINIRKNRYMNVVCYDHSRVVLEPYDLPEGTDTSDPMDYINASFIDGYRQPKAYISTQGPKDTTIGDFWRMIWQTGCRVIVMVTLGVENEILKCDRYWPTSEDKTVQLGVYKIEYINRDIQEDFVATQLRLTNLRSEVSRDVTHFQFISWPDFGVPMNASALLKFRENILRRQLDAIELVGGCSYPPIVVHCSAGVGRSGTFVTVDICIQRLETTGLVDVKGVVEKLRQQRYSSVQTRDQYIFCYKTVLEYAASCGLLDGDDLDDLFR